MVALFGLAFAAARLQLGLAAGRDSLAHSSIGTPSHVECAPAACGRTVSGAVSGVLFTFPSRYSCTVGRRVVLSLGGRSPLLPAGFLVPGGTPDCGPQARAFAYGALTLFRAPSHASSAGHVLCDCGRAVRGPDAASSTPGRQRPHAFRAPRFGLAPVRSPLLGGSLFDFLSSGYLDVSVPPVASHKCG